MYYAVLILVWRGSFGEERFFLFQYLLEKLGDKIQGPSWGRQKRRKPPFSTFWTHVLTPTQGGLEWLEGWLKVA